MDFISKTIDETTLNKFRATSLMNALLSNQMGMVGELLYNMEDSSVLLCPIAENGSMKYSEQLYDQSETTHKLPHYLNCLEVMSKMPQTHMAFYHIFNNAGIRKDLEEKNVEYINKGQEPAPFFVLKDVVGLAFNYNMPVKDKTSLLHCLTMYYSLEDLVKHGDMLDLKQLKEKMSPEIWESAKENDYFAELKKISLPKKKIK